MRARVTFVIVTVSSLFLGLWDCRHVRALGDVTKVRTRGEVTFHQKSEYEDTVTVTKVTRMNKRPTKIRHNTPQLSPGS